jgi:hypothetical protein
MGGVTRHYQMDPSERVNQMGDHAYDHFLSWMKENHSDLQHTHLPDDDAEHTYWQMIYCNEHK